MTTSAGEKHPGPSASRGPIILGWREHVFLPDWGINLRAKIDTGARTSAIHVGAIEELGGGRIRFEVVARERPPHTIWVESSIVRESRVRPTSGMAQSRPVVRTTIRIGAVRREVEVGLVCRKGMLCRMLIGRRALEGVWVVDPSRKYVLGAPGAARGGRA